MRLVALILSGLIFYTISEFIGRRKHIGFWWSFCMLMGGFINGVIAILLSPSAKKEPTKGTKTHQVFGYISIIFLGIIPLIMTIIEINSLFSPDLYFQLPINYWDITRIYWSIRFGIPFSFILTGVYLIQLGRGKIYNSKPKYLLNEIELKFNFLNGLFLKNDFKYYIVEDEIKKGPLSIEQLKEKEIYEDNLIWRKGLKDWSPAKELKELKHIMCYTPPPIPLNNEIKSSVIVIEEIIAETKTEELSDNIISSSDRAVQNKVIKETLVKTKKEELSDNIISSSERATHILIFGIIIVPLLIWLIVMELT